MPKIAALLFVFLFLGCQNQELENLKNHITQDIDPIVNLKFEDIAEYNLYPVVKVMDETKCGTGTIIGSKKMDDKTVRYFILTAKHVVQDMEHIAITIYDYTGNEFVIPNIFKVKVAENIDAAILYFDSNLPHSVALVTDHESDMFTQLFAVSCHLGGHPFLVPGIISLPYMPGDPPDRNFLLFVGESIFGSSGGPVFNYKSKELEGIIIYVVSARVPTNNTAIKVYVPLSYMAYILKWNVIKDWLDTNDLEYVYEKE